MFSNVFSKSSDFSCDKPVISILRAPCQTFKILETFRGCIMSYQLFHKVDIFILFLNEDILGLPNLSSQKIVVLLLFSCAFFHVCIFTMCQTKTRWINDLTVAHTHTASNDGNHILLWTHQKLWLFTMWSWCCFKLWRSVRSYAQCGCNVLAKFWRLVGCFKRLDW